MLDCTRSLKTLGSPHCCLHDLIIPCVLIVPDFLSLPVTAAQCSLPNAIWRVVFQHWHFKGRREYMWKQDKEAAEGLTGSTLREWGQEVKKAELQTCVFTMSWRWRGHQWSWQSSAQPRMGSSTTSLEGAWLWHTHLCTLHRRRPCQTACPLAHQSDELQSLLQGLVMLCEYFVLLYMPAERLWVVKAMCQISCVWWELLNSITNFFCFTEMN